MVTTLRRTDRLLLVEVAMVLGLIVLAIVFYVRPAGEGEVTAPWWKWSLMALVFFGILAFRSWRRRRAGHSALHRVVREEASRVE